MSAPHPSSLPSGPSASPREPLEPALQPLADHLLKTGQLAIEKAIAHAAAPGEFPAPAPGTLEAQLLATHRRAPAEAQQRAIASVMPSVRGDAAARAKRYGALSKVDLRATTAVADQARPLAPALSPSALGLGVAAPKAAGSPIIAVPMYKELQLRLRQVKCVDETDGFLGTEAGDDEIGLGVISLEPDGQVRNLGTFTVGTEFDDGESVFYNPPRVIAAYNLKLDNILMNGDAPLLVKGKQVRVGWPRTYGVVLMLSELDNGGFPGAVAFACDQVRGWVVGELTTYVAGVVGTWIGGPIGAAVGAAIGKVIGEVADAVLGGLVNGIIAIWNDDLFPTVMTRIRLGEPWLDFNKQIMGPNTTLAGWRWVQAHGGRYEMYFEWHLVK